MSEKQTRIERHIIGGFGNPFEFIKQSKEHGKWTCTESDFIDFLKKTAKCDDEYGRKLAIALVNKLEQLTKDNDELRKRFNTMGNVLEQVNNSLREELEEVTQK